MVTDLPWSEASGKGPTGLTAVPVASTHRQLRPSDEVHVGGFQSSGEVASVARKPSVAADTYTYTIDLG